MLVEPHQSFSAREMRETSELPMAANAWGCYTQSKIKEDRLELHAVLMQQTCMQHCALGVFLEDRAHCAASISASSPPKNVRQLALCFLIWIEYVHCSLIRPIAQFLLSFLSNSQFCSCSSSQLLSRRKTSTLHTHWILHSTQHAAEQQIISFHQMEILSKIFIPI